MKISFVIAESTPFDVNGNLKKYVSLVSQAFKKDEGVEVVVFPINAIEGFFGETLSCGTKLPFFIKELQKTISSSDKCIIYASTNFDKIYKVYFDKIDTEPFRKDYKIKENFKISFVYDDYVISQDEEAIISIAPYLFEGQKIYKGGCFISKNTKGSVLIDYMTNDFCIVDTNNLPKLYNVNKLSINFKEENKFFKKFDVGQVYNTLVESVKRYFSHLGVKKAVVGLSGGIDSAVVAAIGTKALGKDNVIGILMPSEFSTEHSVVDAKQLAKNLGIKHFLLPISEIYEKFNYVLKDVFEGKSFDVTEENIQARIRGTLVMAYANKYKAMVLNTSNKSELMVGYGTLYGDLVGSIAVIGDVFKTEVYKLADYINSEKEVIPKNIIEKLPSAELRPGQKDSDALPDYSLLDKILVSFLITVRNLDYVCNNVSLVDAIYENFNEMYNESVDKETVRYVTNLILRNNYKGRQVPPKIILGLYPEIKLPLLFKFNV